MRKNDIIKQLQSIKGNPEIALWNGFVEDWQAIDKTFIPTTLYRLNFNGYKHRVNLDRKFNNLSTLSDDELRGMYKKFKIAEWEMLEYYPPKNDSGYDTKTVYLVQAKEKDKKTFDRTGSIGY